MATNSPNDNQEIDRDMIEAQLRESFGRVVYSHKTHEKCAEQALDKHHRIKFWQIVLSGLTTTSVLGKVFGSEDWVLVVAALLSTLLLVLNSYTKDYDLGEFAQKHRETASKLWLIRETMLSLLTDFKAGVIAPAPVIQRRDELLEELAAVYVAAPPTSSKGYKAAQDALQLHEELTFSDAEIDAFLPKELKKEGGSVPPTE